MPIHLHENQTIKNTVLVIEEHILINCKVVNCRLIFSGGVAEFTNTQFENCMWQFRGAAQNTIGVMVAIGMLKPAQAPPQVVQATSGGPVN